MNASADALPEGVTIAALVKWRDAARKSLDAIGRVRVSYLPQHSPGDVLLMDAERTLQTQADALYSACETQGIAAATSGPDLSALASLSGIDSADARELLSLLEAAQKVAEKVDAQRGRALPDDIPLQPGESRGVDLAERLSELCFRLRGEVSPPKGRGE